LPNKENTLIAGSSMGALVTYYAMLKKPDVFGKAGIFSPTFWTAPGIRALTDSLAPKNSGKFFFYIGGREGKSFINDMQEVQESLGEKSAAQVYSVTDQKGSHNEKAWRKWFPEFYCWIMADGFNYVIKPEE
jgi:predicted alpha/beta superfamily hydrolase